MTYSKEELRERMAEFMKTWRPSAYDAVGNALFTAKELAQIFDCSPGGVLGILHRLGNVRTRTEAEAFKIQ